jgi:hypothetical protein
MRLGAGEKRQGAGDLGTEHGPLGLYRFVAVPPLPLYDICPYLITKGLRARYMSPYSESGIHESRNDCAPERGNYMQIGAKKSGAFFSLTPLGGADRLRAHALSPGLRLGLPSFARSSGLVSRREMHRFHLLGAGRVRREGRNYMQIRAKNRALPGGKGPAALLTERF